MLIELIELNNIFMLNNEFIIIYVNSILIVI